MSSKPTTFVQAFKSYLESLYLGSRVDAVVVTPRTLAEAIDAGVIRPTSTDSVSRVSRAIVIRRRSDEQVDPRAGDRLRLTSAGIFEVVVLVSAEAGVGEAGRATDEEVAFDLYDLVDDVQAAIEAAPTNAATSAYSVEIRAVDDVTDPQTKFYGSIITIAARLLRV